MNILITGGSGFLGKHLIAALVNSGDVVTAIGREEIKDSRVRWIEHDLLQEPSDNIKKRLINIDAVIHLAAIMPSKAGGDTNIVEKNKIMTRNILALVNPPQKFILASSVDVYPYSDIITDENTSLGPVSDYGISKKESEEECLGWSTRHPEMKLLILRFSHLYGPADTNTKMIDTLVKNATLGKKSTIYGDGSDKRTYLFVEDAVKAIRLCLQTTETGIFNVGGSNPYSIKEVIAHLEEILGIKMNLETVPDHRTSLPTKTSSSLVSSQKFAEATGFVAKTDLMRGLYRLLPKNIFFDLDGPLLDVRERYYFVYKQFVTGQGGIPLSMEQYWDLKKSNASLEKLLLLSRCDGVKAAEFKRHLSAHREELSSLTLDRLQPKVKEILGYLSQHYVLYLITLRRNKENLFRQLEELGILAYFKEVLTMAPTTDKKWKHKVDLLTEHSLHDQAGMIIGDTPTEILAGKKTGLTTIAVSNGIRSEGLLQKAEPHLLLNSAEELASLPFFHF